MMANQMEFQLGMVKRHPRDRYLSACTVLDISPAKDYFDNSFYSISGKLDKKSEKLIGILRPNLSVRPTQTIQDTQKAYSLFLDYNSRVIIDGLLYQFSLAQVSGILDIPSEILQPYSEFFFDLSSFKNIQLTSTICATIISKQIRDWYILCGKSTVEEIQYALKGKLRNEKIDATVALNDVFNTAYHTFKTYSSLSPDALLNGPSKRDKDLYNMAMQAASVMVNLGRVFIQYDHIINKTKDGFLSEWEFLLKEEDPDKFITETTAELESQLSIIKPVVSDELLKNVNTSSD